MPTYEWACVCGLKAEVTCPVEARNTGVECSCGRDMQRQLTAPGFKFAGRVVQGGGPDRFTADVLGIPLKDLPAGLRTDKESR